jgi:predicted  nucleic acid-binding Zn-ribbon protein
VATGTTCEAGVRVERRNNVEELNSLEDLLDLQIVDLDIDRLIDRRHNLPELQQYRIAHAEEQRILAALTASEEALRTAELHLDKSEGELEIIQEKRQIEERRLYAGGLGARETVHLREEVEMLGRQVSGLEDEILVHMEERDQRETEVAALRAEHEVADATRAELEALVTAEWKKIDAEIARKEHRKAEMVPLIQPDLLELYEELRPIKDGVAVGRFAEGICGGCHLKLSAGEAAQVLRQSPPRCIYCHRLLVPQ